MRISDLSSDVCSSDLFGQQGAVIAVPEIGIILAQVDDFGALGLHEIRTGDELPVVEDQAAGIAVAEMGFSLDDNHVHGGGNGSRICPVAVRRSDEHTSELQSLMRISYAVFCLKKTKYTRIQQKRDR